MIVYLQKVSNHFKTKNALHNQKTYVLRLRVMREFLKSLRPF